MIFKIKKQKGDSNQMMLVSHYRKLCESYGAFSPNFLESFERLLKLIHSKNGALYFLEKKAEFFVLKKWVGEKPARFSISQNYELIKYLKVKKSPLVKKEFAEGTHDLRQAALFFFQQTFSTHIFPIFLKEKWYGFLTFDLSEVKDNDLNEVLNLCYLYSQNILTWHLYQSLFVENQKLSEVSQVKNQLLANVSHELQTPMNGILGISEAILDGSDGEISDNLRQHVEMIRESGRLLSKTISDFLKLAQIEARKSEVRFEKTNICELIQEVSSLFEESLHKRNIELKIPDYQKPMYVFVEPDQVRTVLMNLLSNASKFTEEGEIRLQTQKSGEMLHVSVVDTGIGIDLEKSDLIFEEFYQADGSHTRVYGGTGLGLAIAKKIINLHGGRIWAKPNRIQGANFTFTVPVCPGV